MKYLIEDPTAGKDDQTPLGPEAWKVIAMAGYIMFCILLVAGGIIYSWIV
jgi:hypothetical protein